MRSRLIPLLLVVLMSLGLSPFLAHACQFENIEFLNDFPTARLNECQQLSNSAFLLTVDAENRPINNSPWYAFKVIGKQAQTIDISLQVVDGKPRYTPKISVDGEVWDNIEFKISDGLLRFSVIAGNAAVWISAQEIIDNEDITQWLAAHSKASYIKHFFVGKSTQGAPIEAVELTQDGNTEWLVIIGRQHPPEVTGSVALLAFAEELFRSSELTATFLQRFNVLIVPNMNPDGVSAGNWRHNSKGVDLNRDWGKFTQAETRAVGSKLESIVAAGGKIVFALDFHSTQQDIFYTMPTDYAIAPQMLVHNWLDVLKQQVISSFVVRNRPGSSPGRGVFKQFIADTYKVNAVTYEMGDNTERAIIKDVAEHAARTLMTSLLTTPPEDFAVSPTSILQIED